MRFMGSRSKLRPKKGEIWRDPVGNRNVEVVHVARGLVHYRNSQTQRAGATAIARFQRIFRMSEVVWRVRVKKLR